MKPILTLKHEFVEYIPEVLHERTVYVTMKFRTAVHLCCCGCGNKVVTPIGQTDWRLTFDGKTISLYPSIGNWDFPCRSHYWIVNNEVRWAEQWTKEEIKAARYQDRITKDRYFRSSTTTSDRSIDSSKEVSRKKSFLRSVIDWLLGRE